MFLPQFRRARNPLTMIPNKGETVKQCFHDFNDKVDADSVWNIKLLGEKVR